MKQDNHGLQKSKFMFRVDGLFPKSVFDKAMDMIATGRYTSWAISKVTGLSKGQIQDLRMGKIIPCKPEGAPEPVKYEAKTPIRHGDITIMDIAKRVRHPNLREIDSVSAGVNVYIGVVL